MTVYAPRKGRQGGFPRSHKSKYREDLRDSFDSSWEANLARYLNHLLHKKAIAGWSRKGSLLLLPTGDTQETKGNRHIEPDFTISAYKEYDDHLLGPEPPWPLTELVGLPLTLTKPHHGILPIILEVKGRFQHGGGLLNTMSESRIRAELASDPDSMIKLIRLKKKYPDRIVYIFGDAEYARLRQEFKAQCPLWEGA